MYQIILQARTNSTRLPAKSLLPIKGMPLVKFCAKRILSNSFTKDLVIATSNENSDDYLTKLLNESNFEVYRGSLKNVSERFHDIIKLKNLNNDDVIIRMTADNPIPDGVFLDEMKYFYEKENFDYFTAQPESIKDSNWPYGLSAEFFSVKTFNNSFGIDETVYNNEHVTPYIKKSAKNKKTLSEYIFFKENYKDVRITIDTLEDYLNIINKIEFNNLSVNTPYRELLKYFITTQKS